MNLLQFKEAEGAGAWKALAVSLNTSVPYLSQLAHGHRKPSHKLVELIEEKTQGAVSRHDLRPDIYGKAQQAA